MNSKKVKRLESKRKKAEAFLALVRQDKEEAVCEQSASGSGMASADQNESVEAKQEGEEEDVLFEMKKIVRERKKAAMQKPKVFLTLEDMVPFRPLPDEPIQPDAIPPLFVMDLQQLLLYGAQGNTSSFKPRWCKLLRVGRVSSVVMILVDGIGYTDYTENTELFPYITGSFPSFVEMVCPLQYNQSVDSELHNVPLSVSQLKKANVRVPEQIRNCVVAKLITKTPEDRGNDFLSRKCLLLSTKQMMQENYPLPVMTKIGMYKEYVFSKDKYKEVTGKSPLLALDCEMCITTLKKSELTRVSIVGESGEVILDRLVKPYNRIINYVTKYSGITKQLLDPVQTRLEDVQREIQEILPPDAILCGQSLNGDLNALKMFHPYVIDTSVVFNMSGSRGVKAGLKKLARFFLDRNIQGSKDGHCSVEDSLATLDLVKLKLQKGLEFGDATLNGVYFPDINTYFMGQESNVKKTENIESELVTPKGQTGRNTCVNSSRQQPASDGGDRGRVNSSVPCVTDKDIPSEKKTAAAAMSDNSETMSDTDGSDSEDESSSPPVKKLKSEEDGTSDSPPSPSKYNFDSTSEVVQEQKRCMFSQQDSVHVNHSFFRILSEAGRPGCLIDRAAVTGKYPTEPIEMVTVESDSAARRAAKREIKSKEFVWLQLKEVTDAGGKHNVSDHRWKKLMRRIDNRVHSVMKQAKENALAVVVFTGQGEGSLVQNMATFIKTT